MTDRIWRLLNLQIWGEIFHHRQSAPRIPDEPLLDAAVRNEDSVGQDRLPPSDDARRDRFARSRCCDVCMPGTKFITWPSMTGRHPEGLHAAQESTQRALTPSITTFLKAIAIAIYWTCLRRSCFTLAGGDRAVQVG